MSPRHDPTDEAETLPGIPKAGSDLEQFPSVPGLQAGAGFSLDVAMQEITVVIPAEATTASVFISAVVLSRTYVWPQGSKGGGSLSGFQQYEGPRQDSWIVQTSPTIVTVNRNAISGVIMTHKLMVVEYL